MRLDHLLSKERRRESAEASGQTRKLFSELVVKCCSVLRVLRKRYLLNGFEADEPDARSHVPGGDSWDMGV